ncbi:MAG: hypothetical protein ABMB14_25850, partial [Myxococcota bacterium]
MKPHTVFAVVSSIVLALPARASSDHFVESQVSAARLAELLRTHFQTESAFCPAPVTCPDTGGTCFVDRIDYPSVGTWSRGSAVNVPINDHTSLPSTEIVYRQPVTVQLKTSDCAYRVGCETTTALPATLEVVLNTVDQDALCFAPQPFERLAVDADPPAPFCLPVDVEALAVLTGSAGSSVTGKAVSLAADGARLGVRFELDRDRSAYDATRIDGWQAFVDGRLAPTSGASDWSAFAHASLLGQGTQATVEAAFAADRDLELRGVPVVTWTGLGSAGGSIDL